MLSIRLPPFGVSILRTPSGRGIISVSSFINASRVLCLCGEIVKVMPPKNLSPFLRNFTLLTFAARAREYLRSETEFDIFVSANLLLSDESLPMPCELSLMMIAREQRNGCSFCEIACIQHEAVPTPVLSWLALHAANW